MDGGSDIQFGDDDISGFNSDDIDEDFLIDEYAPKDTNNETIEPIQKVARNNENKSLLSFESSLQFGDESQISSLPLKQTPPTAQKNTSKTNNNSVDPKGFLQTPVGSTANVDEKSSLTGSRLLVKKTIDKAQDKPKQKVNIFPIALNETSSSLHFSSSTQLQTPPKNTVNDNNTNATTNATKTSQFTLPGIPVISNDQNALPPLNDKNNTNPKPQQDSKTIKVSLGNKYKNLALNSNINSSINLNEKKSSEETKPASIPVPIKIRTNNSNLSTNSNTDTSSTSHVKINQQPQELPNQQSQVPPNLQPKQIEAQLQQQNQPNLPQQLQQQTSQPQFPQQSQQQQIIPQKNENQQQDQKQQNTNQSHQQQQPQSQLPQQNQQQATHQQPQQTQKQQQPQVQQNQNQQQQAQPQLNQPQKQTQQNQHPTAQQTHPQAPQNQQQPQPIQTHQPPPLQPQPQPKSNQPQPQTSHIQAQQQPNQQHFQPNHIQAQQQPNQQQPHQQLNHIQAQQQPNQQHFQPNHIQAQQQPNQQQPHQQLNHIQAQQQSNQTQPHPQVHGQPPLFSSVPNPSYIAQPQQQQQQLQQPQQSSTAVYSYQQQLPYIYCPSADRLHYSFTTALDSSFSSIRRSVASELSSALRSANSARNMSSVYSLLPYSIDVDDFCANLTSELTSALSFAAPIDQTAPTAISTFSGLKIPAFISSDFDYQNGFSSVNVNFGPSPVENQSAGNYQTMLHSYQKEPLLLRPLAREIGATIDREMKPLSSMMKSAVESENKAKCENVAILTNLLKQVEELRTSCKGFGDEIIRELEREELVFSSSRDVEVQNTKKKENKLREMKMQYIEAETKASQQILELKKMSDMFERLKQQQLNFIERQKNMNLKEKNRRARMVTKGRSSRMMDNDDEDFEIEQVLDEIEEINREIKDGGYGQIYDEIESLEKYFQNDKNGMKNELMDEEYFNQQLLSYMKLKVRNSNMNNYSYYSQNMKQAPAQFNLVPNDQYLNTSINANYQRQPTSNQVKPNPGKNQSQIADTNKRMNALRKQRDSLMQGNLA